MRFGFSKITQAIRLLRRKIWDKLLRSSEASIAHAKTTKSWSRWSWYCYNQIGHCPGNKYISRKRSNAPNYLQALFESVFSHFKDLSKEQTHNPTWLKANKPLWENCY